MSTSYKPDSYNSVSPYLICGDASTTIEFLKQVFDAEELLLMSYEDGRIMHAEVRVDDSIIMLSEGPEGSESIPALVHIYVQDVDTIYKHAIQAGATSIQEPPQDEEADKRGGVTDANGINWWFTTWTG